MVCDECERWKKISGFNTPEEFEKECEPYYNDLGKLEGKIESDDL